MKKKWWDAIIVGGGPAGLAAGLYLARVGFSVLIIEKGELGGQARLIERIENYPGFPRGISGSSLMKRFALQAKRWGLKVLKGRAVSVRKTNGFFEVEAENRFRAKALIFSAGTAFKKLGIEGEAKFLGRGVHNAAFDNAPEFKGKRVAVVGGGDSALHQALLLSRWAKEVNLIHRGKSLKATGLLQKRLKTRSNIEIHLETVVENILGAEKFKRIEIRDLKTGEKKTLEVQGIFVLIGKEPDLKLAKTLGKQAGVFFAGDIHNGEFRQVAIAAGDGLRAAMKCEDYLTKN